MQQHDEHNGNVEARTRSLCFLLLLVIAGLFGVLIGLLIERWLTM